MPSSVGGVDLNKLIGYLQIQFNKYRQFDFRLFYSPEKMQTVLGVACKLDIGIHNRRTVQYVYKFTIDDAALVRMSQDELSKFVFDLVCDFILCMDEEDTGKYPLHRVYVDNHLRSGEGAPLLGSPHKDVEGWQFNRMRGVKWTERKAPTHIVGIDKHVLGSVTFDQQGNRIEAEEAQEVLKSFSRAVADRLKPIDKNTVEGLREAVATGTKKKKVVTRNPKPPIDPNKIKKPECPKHGTRMEFDPVKGKWRCQTEGCKIVARPERDEDDKSVVLGKGEIALRIVMADGEATVLLISDDNVALNITNLVSIEDIIGHWDLVTAANASAENGQENFTVPVKKPLRIDEIRLGVIGATDLAETFEE